MLLPGSDDVLAEEPDGVRHVGSERGAEDNLGDAAFLSRPLLLHHLGGTGDGEGIDLLVADELADGLEVELAEGILDLRDLGQVEAMAGEELGRRAAAMNTATILAALRAFFTSPSMDMRFGTDVKGLLAYRVGGLLDDRDGDLENLRVGRVDECPVADPAGELEAFGPWAPM